MKKATLEQAEKILKMFKGISGEQIQAILESGVLADVRDGNFGEAERDAWRKAFGLKPLSTLGYVERVRIINETTIMVNLGALPNLPFDGAKIDFQTGSGWVKVEKRPDGLYVDNRKITFYLSERQKGGRVIQGYKLREELSGKPVLHSNIMDALYDNQHLIPQDWKKDEKGNTRFIFFWSVIFRRADGNLCVRCFFFSDSRWDRHYHWLDYHWYSNDPVALLAS